jgi:hypothetical protein
MKRLLDRREEEQRLHSGARQRESADRYDDRFDGRFDGRRGPSYSDSRSERCDPRDYRESRDTRFQQDWNRDRDRRAR